MIFNILIFLLLVLMTLYLSTQGLLSSLLALVTAIFSSILAMALFEPLVGPMAGFRPDYARGVTFLLLFLLTFGGTRLAADMAVPKNIKLPLLINRIGGGGVGFFAAMVVLGTTIIGIEMLPVERSLLGFDRFPSEKVMQSESTPGVAARLRNGIWFAPDRFVLTIWSGASGRGLGGNVAFKQIHPDLTAESYGYRNSVAGGSARALPPDLLEIQTGSITEVEGKNMVIVRAALKKGDKAPNSSADSDSHFRLSATQARLTTKNGKQYYPIGYLKKGTEMTRLNLDDGVMVEDFPAQGNQPVLIDLVFQLERADVPNTIEIKQLARKSLDGVLKNTPIAPAAANAYPPREYERNRCTLTVTFDPRGQTISSASVFLLSPSIAKKDIESEINAAYSNIEAIKTNMSTSQQGWSTTFKAGLPSQGRILQAERLGTDQLKNTDRNTQLNWQTLIPFLLLGQSVPDPARNVETAQSYLNDTLVKIWRTPRAEGPPPLVQEATLAADARNVQLVNIIPGEYMIVIVMRTPRGYFVDARTKTFEPRNNIVEPMTTQNAAFYADLDATQ